MAEPLTDEVAAGEGRGYLMSTRCVARYALTWRGRRYGRAGTARDNSLGRG